MYYLYNNIKNKKVIIMSKEIIIEYLHILKRANEPLYAHQVKNIKKDLDEIEPQITEDILDDLLSLGDKDLCIKYNLEPRVISSKYLNVELEDIKPSLKRLDINRMKNNFLRQYNEYEKRGWI